MFRSGSTGIALLIMRLSLAAALLSNIWFGAARPFAFTSAAIVIAALLCLGAFTSVASLLFCLTELWLMASAGRDDARASLIAFSMAIALALLGPGAYSLDARIFGRRVIVLPRKNL